MLECFFRFNFVMASAIPMHNFPVCTSLVKIDFDIVDFFDLYLRGFDVASRFDASLVTLDRSM